MTRKISRQDIIVITLLGVAVILILSGVSEIAIGQALIAGASFCGLVYLYARLVPRDEPDPHSTRNLHQDRNLSLRQQARIVDGFPEAVIMINRQERIIYANEAAKSLLEISDIGASFSGSVRDPAIRDLITDVLSGHTPQPVNYHIDMPVERHLQVLGSPIAPDNNQDPIQRAIIVFYDMTELVHANTMRADFLANASHELKTPVASLLGYIETLQGHAKDDREAREQFLNIMKDQAERMQRLIDDLLSLRRIEQVEHLAPSETADLYLAIRAAIESVKPLAKSRQVKINYDGPKDVPVIGVQDELVQVILNLLDNALGVTSEKGSIEISLEIISKLLPVQTASEDAFFKDSAKRRIVIPAHTSDSFACVRIRDNGPGFAREHLPRLGERFYKIRDTDIKGKRGTGLGLAIIKHIIRHHRGGFFIESHEGTGTEFSVLIPRATQHENRAHNG